MKRIRGVYERDPGSGVYWIRYADAFGRTRKEKVGPKPLAIAAYRKRKTEVREGKLLPTVRHNRVSFGELCDDFSRAKPNHWSARTGKGMVDLLRKWFGSNPASLVTPQRIEEKLNGLVADGRTPATANRYRSICSAIFTWAVRNDRVASNPVRAVRIRREDNHRIRFLEDNEETRLRFAVRELAPEREAELTLALNTGLRLGEQYSLTWSDVDFDRGFLLLLNTKSGRPRTIPLNADARAALLELRRFRKANRVCTGHPRPWFERSLSSAKISGFRWHDLRHTFASRLVMAGVDLRTVQDLMGHQTVTMTQRYAHLSDPHKAAAVEKLVRESPQQIVSEVKPRYDGREQ